jgi:hypothetical protein
MGFLSSTKQIKSKLMKPNMDKWGKRTMKIVQKVKSCQEIKDMQIFKL